MVLMEISYWRCLATTGYSIYLVNLEMKKGVYAPRHLHGCSCRNAQKCNRAISLLHSQKTLCIDIIATKKSWYINIDILTSNATPMKHRFWITPLVNWCSNKTTLVSNISPLARCCSFFRMQIHDCLINHIEIYT